MSQHPGKEGTILAVSAHPDDIEFTSGGALARWSAEGWAVHLVVCTDGGKGSHDPTMDPAALAAQRREEQHAAARALGITHVLFLDHADGGLGQTPALAEALTRLIRHLCPDRLLGWDPWRRYQLHPDHRAAGLAILDAALAAGNPHYYPEQLADGLAVHRIEEAYLFGTEEPDTWVDITATFERKLAAIACHRSQVERWSEVVENLGRCNRDYGQQCGYAYAEGFKVLRPFCDI